MGPFGTAACGPIVPLSPMISPHSSPDGAMHHIGTRDLCQRRRELYKEFCQHIVIHGGTRFFYMPQSWDMGQILSLPLRRKACGGFFRCPKNPTTSAGFEPENSGTRGQHANHQTTEGVSLMTVSLSYSQSFRTSWCPAPPVTPDLPVSLSLPVNPIPPSQFPISNLNPDTIYSDLSALLISRTFQECAEIVGPQLATSRPFPCTSYHDPSCHSTD